MARQMDSTGIAAKFLENGIIGACVIVLAVVVWRLYRANQRANEARIAEAKAVTVQLLGLSTKWIEAIEALTSAMKTYNTNVEQIQAGCRQRMEELRSLVREMISDMRQAIRGGGR